MLKLRTDTRYVTQDGKLTQAGYEALQGLLNAQAADIATLEAAVAGSFIRPQAAVSASGQTSIDVTGIPSWVNRVTVTLSGISTSGTSIVLVQIGDSGGIETTGYGGSSSASGNGGAPAAAVLSAGFSILFGSLDTAAATRSGSMTLTRQSGNTWACASNVGLGNVAATSTTGGAKSLSDALTQVRLTTVIGTDTFDAGSVNISWE